jgi:hypothetical protein
MATTSRSAVKKPFTKDRFQCGSRKVRYRDKRELTRSLHRMQNKRRFQLLDEGVSERNEIRGYLCPDCRGWHATSKPESSDYKGNAN